MLGLLPFLEVARVLRYGAPSDASNALGVDATVSFKKQCAASRRYHVFLKSNALGVDATISFKKQCAGSRRYHVFYKAMRW